MKAAAQLIKVIRPETTFSYDFGGVEVLQFGQDSLETYLMPAHEMKRLTLETRTRGATLPVMP